ncbi:MAG TPA: DCC1-like thiol-disulfide oxidoreductase family protein [Gemmatimonadaceae bacterium]|nr:DCC1-like thiol-disulfide oxidoreductase family protein [Gemmatimonadaceae bacterium]
MSQPMPLTAPQAADGPILVYDGDCGFCARSLQFVLQHDRRGVVRFAARDGDAGRALRERHALQAVESLLWVDTRDGREVVYIYSDAVLQTARYLGGVYAFLGTLGGVVPRLLRDPVYNFIAKVRKRIMGGAAACHLPAPSELARMLP